MNFPQRGASVYSGFIEDSVKGAVILLEQVEVLDDEQVHPRVDQRIAENLHLCDEGGVNLEKDKLIFSDLFSQGLKESGEPGRGSLVLY